MDDVLSQGGNAPGPLVIGHRGASGILPENTIAAFRGALEAGADGIELDVRLSADGIPVVSHDATTTRTTGIRSRVADRTAAELAEIPARRTTSRRVEAPSPIPRFVAADLGVPTLARVIELASSWEALVYVELKGRRTSDGDLELEVVSALARGAYLKRSVVLSFNHAALRRVKHLDPRVRTAATIAPTLGAPRPSPARLVEMVIRASADEAALHVSLATKRRVDALRAHGLRVCVWTVNSPLVADHVARLGVDAVMTDYPERLGRAAGRR